MRVRKERLKKDWWGGVDKSLSPGKYRQVAIKVYGKAEGTKKADVHQRKYYEKQAVGKPTQKKAGPPKKDMTEEEKRAALRRANIRARKKTKKKK